MGAGMDVAKIETQIREISDLLGDKLGVKGKTLETQSRRIGRLLPKKLRRDVTYLAQAQVLSQNPKLLRMVDELKVRQAHRVLVDYLQTIDPADRRKGALLSALGIVVFNLLVVFVVLVAVLRWRGIV